MEHAHSPGTLDLTGEGIVRVKADIASLRLTVVTRAKSAAEAVTSNAARAEAVVAAITARGIPSAALATAGLRLFPVYEYDKAAEVNRLVGYQAEDTIQADVAVARAGEVFDAGIAAGADESSGLTFKLGDQETHRRRALAAAVHAARTEAKAVAEAFGAHLSGLIKIEVEAGASQVIVTEARTMKAATPVLPADLSVVARVRATYRIEG